MIFASNTGTATVEVIVIDRNDHTPVFEQATYVASVREMSPIGSTVVTANSIEKQSLLFPLVQATDKGVDPEQRSAIATVEISVLDDNDNYPQFTERTYLIDVPEDIEWASRPVIAVVKAEDKDLGVNAAIRVLDANDNDPKFYTSLIQDSVSEGVPIGHSVLRVQAYDADDGPNSEIVYSILPTDQPIPFAVDRIGSPSRSSTASIIIRVQDINDNDPVFEPKSYEASVSEIDPPGTPVVGVTATDRDEEPRLIYHISEGNHRVTDAGGRYDTATVHINVTDANTHRPVFEKVPYTASVSEDAVIGTTVLVVEASDGDVGENARISYFIEDNPEFTIDSATGAISTSQTLDRELTAGFVLVVTAQDHGSPSLSDTINVEVEVLDVNDNPPNFILPSYSASIREDALVGLSVLQVSASDKDIGLSGQVRYTFSGGEDGDGAFIVEPTSGIIRTNQMLDRESVSKYKLVVHAVDRGVTPLSSSAAITVNIEDVNDNPPRFDTDVVKLFVSENSPIGSLVGEIMATDPDEGPNADIFYSIVGGQDGDKFNLISRNGGAELCTKTYLDYETSKKKYVLIIRAASPPLRNDVEVNVWVTDVNDNAPRLRDFVIVFNHHKNHFPKNPIGKVPAYDADVTDRLRYKFISGNNANLLILNEKKLENSLLVLI
ncbi:protocadherin-like wing polarity protein stan [Caerostris extrusa]|uniref:Protocadherin-like wing polarity protein stan n=1 Tax=Caerostris extrusa TaxID=172846 RepID=A0AAV4UMT5_CAEEX|nr:protocadherin-like wing polarity protein stan [Caerostris extrusa]